uniref:Sodium-dependent nutrient amino acid transporter 1 n=1 Tax=Megaselia scalaris TaxID=36166 RepID=T1GN94_MEGSC
GFFSGLVYLTPGGQWILNLVDTYGGTYVVFCLAVFEMVGIFWVYGLQSFCDDMEFMINRKVTVYWRVCWTLITPGLMAIMFLYSIISLERIQYSGWEYPDSAIVAGWLIFVIGLIQFPLWTIWVITHNNNKTVLQLLKPTEEWGPVDSDLRANWKLFKRDREDERKRAHKTNKI